jgi:hypothetical protein
MAEWICQEVIDKMRDNDAIVMEKTQVLIDLAIGKGYEA